MAKFVLPGCAGLMGFMMATSSLAIAPPFPDSVLASEQRIVSALSQGRPSSLDGLWDTDATVTENGRVIGRGGGSSSALQRYASGMAIEVERLSYGLDSLMIVATVKSPTMPPAKGVTECCTWASVMRFDLDGQGKIKALSVLEQPNGAWQSPPVPKAGAD